ncbi:MAG: diacylglycerol kinase [Erysipelotrichaceae bacterium]|nr:diacylglycerol kinase [Erysipelotrichaceae bacterium]
MRSVKDKFVPAFSGLWDLLRTEGSIRLQFYCGTLAFVFGILLGFTYLELLVVAVLSVIVITLECCNTLFEWLMDAWYPKFNPVAKRMKDGAAGMVLLASIFSFLIGVWMIWNHL